jgi:hypothetical protein
LYQAAPVIRGIQRDLTEIGHKMQPTTRAIRAARTAAKTTIKSNDFNPEAAVKARNNNSKHDGFGGRYRGE